ncbi:DUF3108 domain-containing protein [Shewanella cyperi]|nr:DUF3108 domain-containing protein [Shewanella cyperi]
MRTTYIRTFMRALVFALTALLSLALPAAWAQSPLAPQSAEYKVFYGDIELGQARYILPPPDGNFYQYQFDSSLSLLVLSDMRHIRSEFTLEGNNLTPVRFMHQREGTGPTFNEQAAFLKNQGVVHSRYKDEKAKLPYEGELYDPMTVQLQLRLDLSAGKEHMLYRLVKDNEIDDYEFKLVGKEQLILASGSYDTVKLEVIRKSKKRQTFIWFAPSLAYLPVRLTHFEKGDKQLDIQLLSHQFSDTPPQLANSPAS